MRWVVPVTSSKYGAASGFARLYDDCLELEKDTELVRVNDPSQFLIHVQFGTTADGWKFNTQAFTQACQMVSPGLGQLCQHLWSESSSPADLRQKVILTTYNNAVKLIGKGVVGRKFVVNKKTGVIVGVVGRTYKYVPNAELLRIVRSKFSNNGDYAMVKAVLWNRDLMMLSIRKSAQQNLRDLTFRQGLALYNSETTRQAIYVPRAIFDTETRGYSLEPESKSTRLIHRKTKGFNQKLDEVVMQGFSGGDLLELAVQKYREMVSHVLFDRGNQSMVIPKIMSRLITKSVSTFPTERVINLLTSKAQCTRWDLYKSLVSTAGDFTGSERSLRNIAYGYLMQGKF